VCCVVCVCQYIYMCVCVWLNHTRSYNPSRHPANCLGNKSDKHVKHTYLERHGVMVIVDAVFSVQRKEGHKMVCVGMCSCV